MKVSELVTLLQAMPQDLEVEVNDNNNGEVYPVKDISHYVPNIDLWPNDVPSVVIQVN